MKRAGLGQLAIVGLVAVVLLTSIALVYLSQELVERDAFVNVPNLTGKEQYEIAKLAAEIRQIRSDTGGSLFWLKMMALLVTVGGAVGGYLIGQSHYTRSRVAFANKKNVDTVYQGIVKELSDKSPLLRAAAAVKLGTVLKSFPAEWAVEPARQEQLVDLTKQVLAAALAIEQEPKVLKTLTAAIALHRPWQGGSADDPNTELADLRRIDLSAANAADAYWARVNFTEADFYRAVLSQTSFRRSILQRAQFREAKLQGAVFAATDCDGANFKLADLRGADLSAASIVGTTFEGAKVAGVSLTNAKAGRNPSGLVDESAAGDGSALIAIEQWLTAAGVSARSE